MIESDRRTFSAGFRLHFWFTRIFSIFGQNSNSKNLISKIAWRMRWKLRIVRRMKNGTIDTWFLIYDLIFEGDCAVSMQTITIIRYHLTFWVWILKSKIYSNFECSTSGQSGNKDVNSYMRMQHALCMSIPIINGQTKIGNFNKLSVLTKEKFGMVRCLKFEVQPAIEFELHFHVTKSIKVFREYQMTKV